MIKENAEMIAADISKSLTQEFMSKEKASEFDVTAVGGKWNDVAEKYADAYTAFYLKAYNNLLNGLIAATPPASGLVGIPGGRK